jgi:hypothetical protein
MQFHVYRTDVWTGFSRCLVNANNEEEAVEIATKKFDELDWEMTSGPEPESDTDTYPLHLEAEAVEEDKE